MTANTDSDGGDVNNFSPAVVTGEAEIAESLRLPMAKEAQKIKTVLEKTNAVALKLESSWWGNEAFGVWSEWFFVHPDGVSPSGKALFVNKGVAMNDPVSYLRAANDARNSRGGLTSKAARRFESKAYNDWFDEYYVGPGGGKGMDDRKSFKDGSCPLSVVDRAFRLPEPDDDLLFPADGEQRNGKLSEGDIRVAVTTRTKYGKKAVLTGDTYDAFSSGGDNLSEEVPWEKTHLSFNGDAWTCDLKGDALLTVIDTLNEHGYDVAVDESFQSRLDDADSGSLEETFGVGT